MQIYGLHHVAISVQDLERSVEFYSEMFGFKEVQRFKRRDLHGKASFLALHDTFIEIWQVEKVQPPQDTLTGLNVIGIRHLALAVSDLEKIYEQLKIKTDISAPIMGASGKRLSFLTDPDGISIELYEHQKGA